MILISQHLTGFANFFTRFYKQDINIGEGVVNSGLKLSVIARYEAIANCTSSTFLLAIA